MEQSSDTLSNTDILVTDDRLVMPVDAEHGGIRAVGCLSLLISFGISYFFLANVFGLTAIIALLGSIAISTVTSYGLEWGLKQTWKSGRKVIADDNRIALIQHNEVEREVDAQQQVNVLTWYFEVTRSARVKKGWYVIGLALQQEDTLLPVYTFASPEYFENMPIANHFTELHPKDDRKKHDDAPLKNMRKAGEQRRLLEAEQDRGMFGAEVTRDQFEQYVEYLQTQYPKWMITA